MYTQRGADAYRSDDTNTMTQEKIIVALYERMVSDLNEAGEAIGAEDRLKMTARVNHSQQIVVELRNSLDHSIGGDISHTLESLYDFLFQEHLQLLVDCNPDHISNCIGTIEPLLAAWRKIPVGTCERAQRQHAKGNLIASEQDIPVIVAKEGKDQPAELVSESELVSVSA